MFNDTFLSTLDAHAPIKSIWILSRPCPHLTPEIKDQMTFRDQLFRRYWQSRNADPWKAYKEAQTSVKQLLKNAECDHICTEVRSHKDNPGSLWKIINTCIPSKEKETPVHSRDTELVANDFNQFLSSVGRNAAQTATQLAIDNNINISDTSLISPPTTRNSSEKLFTPLLPVLRSNLLYHLCLLISLQAPTKSACASSMQRLASRYPRPVEKHHQLFFRNFYISKLLESVWGHTTTERRKPLGAIK